MANIAPANFAYVNANGDKGDVQVLSDADITLLNEGLQDIEDLKLAIQKPLPLPAGTMIHFAGNVVPEGFLVCNGAAVSRTDYANLFAAIGTLYGAGDGSTTFNLPDARDRVLQGASSTYAVGTSIAAGLPNIIGYTTPEHFGDGARDYGQSGALYLSDSGERGGAWSAATDTNIATLHINASRYSSIYGTSTTVQQSAVASYILIKV